MSDLSEALLSALSGVKCLAVLTAGSHLRADDAAGMLAGEELEKLLPQLPAAPATHVFLGETAPENFTGAIRAVSPTHLLLIDAADMGKAPGFRTLLELGPSTGSLGSTHKMPLQVMVDYVHHTMSCKVVSVGIQPASCHFGGPVCEAVATAAAELAAELAAVMKTLALRA